MTKQKLMMTFGLLLLMGSAHGFLGMKKSAPSQMPLDFGINKDGQVVSKRVFSKGDKLVPLKNLGVIKSSGTDACFEVYSSKVKAPEAASSDRVYTSYQSIYGNIVLGAHQLYQALLRDQKALAESAMADANKKLRDLKKSIKNIGTPKSRTETMHLKIIHFQNTLKEAESLSEAAKLVEDLKSEYEGYEDRMEEIDTPQDIQGYMDNLYSEAVSGLIEVPKVDQIPLTNSYCEEIIASRVNPDFSDYVQKCFSRPSIESEFDKTYRKMFCGNPEEQEKLFDINPEDVCQEAFKRVVKQNKKSWVDRDEGFICSKLDEEIMADARIRGKCEQVRAGQENFGNGIRQLALFQDVHEQSKQGKKGLRVNRDLRMTRFYQALARGVHRINYSNPFTSRRANLFQKEIGLKDKLDGINLRRRSDKERYQKSKGARRFFIERPRYAFKRPAGFLRKLPTALRLKRVHLEQSALNLPGKLEFDLDNRAYFANERVALKYGFQKMAGVEEFNRLRGEYQHYQESHRPIQMALLGETVRSFGKDSKYQDAYKRARDFEVSALREEKKKRVYAERPGLKALDEMPILSGKGRGPKAPGAPKLAQKSTSVPLTRPPLPARPVQMRLKTDTVRVAPIIPGSKDQSVEWLNQGYKWIKKDSSGTIILIKANQKEGVLIHRGEEMKISKQGKSWVIPGRYKNFKVSGFETGNTFGTATIGTARN